MKTKTNLSISIFIYVITLFGIAKNLNGQMITPNGQAFSANLTIPCPTGLDISLMTYNLDPKYPGNGPLSTGANSLFVNEASFANGKLSKKAGTADQFYFLGNSGDLYLYTLTSCAPPTFNVKKIGKIPDTVFSGQNWQKMVGDKLYSLESGFIMSSADSGLTWKDDTAGIDGANGVVSDITIDTNQNVYAYSYFGFAGLFYQSASSNIWTRVNSFHNSIIGNNGYLFVDRRNRLWVNTTTTDSVYLSTDNANTFKGYLIPQNFSKFTDDVYGNIYGLGMDGRHLYRSRDTGKTWVSIGKPIILHSLDTLGNYNGNSIINDISGDSILGAATIFGMYFSIDQGNTWLHDTSIHSTNITGYQQLGSGRNIISADLGTFVQNTPDTSWSQTYPVGYYQPTWDIATGPTPTADPLGEIWKDGADNLYMRSRLIGGNMPSMVRSIDRGATWQQDTLGLAALGLNGGTFYVDSLGNMHMGSGGKAYVKPYAGAWTIDTLGLGGHGLVSIDAFIDCHGILYASGAKAFNFSYNPGVVMKRSLSGGPWSVDTTGLNQNWIQKFTKDANGNPIGSVYSPPAGYYPVLLYHHNNSWHNIPAPAASEFDYIPAITMDASNGLLVYLEYNSYTYGWQGFGIYCSHDTGVTWNKVGLDSILTYQLESFGDTSYALTQAGLYKLTCSGVIVTSTSPATPASPIRNSAKIYPNPNNGNFTLEYNLSNSDGELRIMDIMGKIVYTSKISNQEDRRTVNVSGLNNGIYFWQVFSGDKLIDKGKIAVVK